VESKIIDVFVSDAWLKENDWLTWPALTLDSSCSWSFYFRISVKWNSTWFIRRNRGFIYCCFGNWVPSIQTLSFVLITTPICFVLGLSFGIWGYLNKKVETALQPVLNVMQTMPQFAYLVPIMRSFWIR